MYQITDYSYKKAKKLGVIIKPSTRKGKKIDIYKKGIYLFSIGQLGYYDYPSFLAFYGKGYADKRRKLYKLRHEKTRKIKNSASFYADNILW